MIAWLHIHPAIQTEMCKKWIVSQRHMDTAEWHSVKGSSDWTLGKGSSLSRWSIAGTGSPQHQACQSSGRSLLVVWFNGLVLNKPARRRELALVFMGPFQLRTFFDSVCTRKCSSTQINSEKKRTKPNPQKLQRLSNQEGNLTHLTN